MQRKLTVGAVAAVATATALTGSGLALASGHVSPQAGGTSGHVAAKGDGEGVTTCRGGRQKRTVTKINNQYSTFGEGVDFAVPGMDLVVKGPRRGYDTLDLTFSAETQLRGSSPDELYNWMELEVLVDGSPIQPYGTPSDPLAIGGHREYGSDAAQFCTRIGRGTHTVSVVTRLVDSGADDSLTGWIDDTTLRAVISQ